MDQPNLRRPAERVASDRPFAETEAALEKAGRIEELIRLYEGRARETPTAEAVRVLVRAGQLAYERLRNPIRSEELLRRALLIAEDPRPVLRGLKIVYEARQDIPALVDVLERLGSLSQGEEASTCFVKAANFHEQKLFRRDRAVLCLQQATRVKPDRALFKRTRQLLLSEERFQPIFESLERERAALGGEGMVEEYLAFAERLVEDPTEHELAQQALAVVRELDPQNVRVEKATQTLQRFEQAWRERARMLRGMSLEERDRKSAARLSLLVAKLHAWYDAGRDGQGEGGAGSLLPAVARHARGPQPHRARGRAQWGLRAGAGLVRGAGGRGARAQCPGGPVAEAGHAAPHPPQRRGRGARRLREGRHRGPVARGRGEPRRGAAAGAGSPGRCPRHAGALPRHGEGSRDAGGPAAAARGSLPAAEGRGRGEGRTSRPRCKLDPANALAAFQLARLLAEDENFEALEPLLDLALLAPRPRSERVAFCEGLALLYEERGRRAGRLRGARARPRAGSHPAHAAGFRDGAASKAQAEPELARGAAARRAVVAPPEAALALWRHLAQLLQGTLRGPGGRRGGLAGGARARSEDSAAQEAVRSLRAAAALADDPQDAPGGGDRPARGRRRRCRQSWSRWCASW